MKAIQDDTEGWSDSGRILLYRPYEDTKGWLEKRPKYCQKEIIVMLWGREGAETRTEKK